MIEELDDLPSGWTLAAIGDVTENKVGQQGPAGVGEFIYVDISSVDNVTKTIFGPKTITIKDAPSRARQHIKAGDVLVSMTRPKLNAVAKVSQELDGAIASTGFDVLRGSAAEPDWLFAHVRSKPFVDAMSELVRGALYPAVNAKEVRAYTIPLPPLPEQRRIVAKLEALQARSRKAREALEAIPPLLEQFRQSVLAAAFRGDLTANSREQNDIQCKGTSECEALCVTPDSWSWMSLESVCEPKRNICYGVIKLGENVAGGVPCLRTSDVRSLRITADNVKCIALELSNEYRRTVLRGGEVLVNVRGTLGGVASVPMQMSGWNVSREVAVVPVASLNPDFVARWIASPVAQSWLDDVSKGVAYTGINIADLRKLPIPVPSAEEQLAIVNKINSLLTVNNFVESELHQVAAEMLKVDQSILAKAFRGELVPQDPNDEPATVLLERIRAQRAKQTNGKPDRGRRKRSSNPEAEITADDEDGPAVSNGKDQSATESRRPIDDYSVDELMPFFRSAIRGAGDMTQDGLLRDIAQLIGFERLSPQIRTTLEGHLRTAIRRGIVERNGDFVRAATPTFQRYSDELLFKAFASVMRPGYEYDRDDVVRAVAEHLGYSQVTAAMRDRMKSVFNSAIRRGVVARRGPTAIGR